MSICSWLWRPKIPHVVRFALYFHRRSLIGATTRGGHPAADGDPKGAPPSVNVLSMFLLACAWLYFDCYFLTCCAFPERTNYSPGPCNVLDSGPVHNLRNIVVFSAPALLEFGIGSKIVHKCTVYNSESCSPSRNRITIVIFTSEKRIRHRIARSSNLDYSQTPKP